MLQKKRGQITLFIIIGLLILLTYFLLSYYRTEKIEETELIMPELIPVQQYVETCTKTLAREAIEIIGVNGGYIYFPAWIENDASSYLSLSPIKDLKNPYWRYHGINAIPPIDFIETQISDYARAGMANCIDNFSAFYNKYDIISLGDFDVITEIGKEDVTVKTIYPIEVKDKFNKTLAELQKYIVKIPIRLKKVHDLAAKIMEQENRDFFIERKAIDLISLDDDEIPTTGIEIKCGKKRWLLEDVENKLKQLLSVNLPYIKIKGTKFNDKSRIIPYQLQDVNPFSESNAYNESYYYYHYIWDVSDIPYSNMHVGFNYDPKWDITFYARPSKGKYLETNPQRAGQILSLFCLHIWHFTYDVIFPVKVTIVDDKTAANEEYSFTFAFKAQINHNQPDTTDFGIASFETRDTYMEEEYCADVENEITIYAVDKVSKNQIRNVNLTFTCGRYYCNMGVTKSYWEQDPSGIPKLVARFPYCSNGVLRGSREGYEDGQIFIQTGRRLDIPADEQIGNAFTIEMRPIKFFNFTVVKHKLIGQGISGPISLEENEQAMVTIKNAEEKFESYSAYPIEEDAPLKLLDKKDINYDLEVIIMDNESITGGYKTTWAVSQIDLRLGKNITFHTVEKDFRDEEERYAFFAGLEGYSKKAPLPEVR